MTHSPELAQTVLLVEDKPLQARQALNALRKSGFTNVAHHTKAEDARAALLMHPEHFCAVITDQHLDHGGGTLQGSELVEWLIDQGWKQPIILHSIDERIDVAIVSHGPMAILHKPESLEQLGVTLVKLFGQTAALAAFSRLH